MAEYLSPGVYVEGFDSGSRPMEGVSTSTTGFVGLAERGPAGGLPVLVTNYSEFARIFGGFLPENQFGDYRFLAYSVYQYFVNGGSRCYISRVVPKNAETASYIQQSEQLYLKLTAKNPGAWGNKVKVSFTPSSKGKTQILEAIAIKDGTNKYRVKSSPGFQAGDVVAFSDGENMAYNVISAVEEGILQFADDFTVDVVDARLLPDKVLASCEFNMEISCAGMAETYDNLSFNINAPNYIVNKLAKSELLDVEAKAGSEKVPPYRLLAEKEAGNAYGVTLGGGSDGSLDQVDSSVFIGIDPGPGKRTGLQAFLDNMEVSLMVIPGITDLDVQLSLTAHCENLNRFAILDLPKEKISVTDVLAYKSRIDSQYAAFYHPWIEFFDPLAKKNAAFPPSGAVAGIYASTDQARGVHKAPANEVVRGCTGLAYQYSADQQSELNPQGVNLICSFPGQGIRVWGARTCTSHNNLWKYVNLRRLFIFLEESIKSNSNWVVFEPNNQILWERVERSIESFLTGIWRNGALAGTSPEEAFFVDIGPQTMTQDDIDNGRLICIIGAAPVKPAEFVIFRIMQKTGEP